MSLEQQIVDWGASRPAWQRAILRRVALREVISDEEYDRIVDSLSASRDIGDARFGLEQLPEINVGDPSVRLVSIAQAEHVNALESEKPLTFEANGLTIVYGDNASGKSGYARLLKRIARARHQEEEILSDVFEDSALAKPKAAITVSIGVEESALSWPESTPPELQRMRFHDQACGEEYVAVESNFPYRPSALFVMDGLIQACIEVRTRIDAKLLENARSAKTLPTVDPDIKDTESAKYLAGRSGASSLETLNELLRNREASSEALDNLRNEEARLLGADPGNERQKLIRQATKLESLIAQVERVDRLLGEDSLRAAEIERERLNALEKAADLDAKVFESEPLPGAGSSPWKELWEAARRFSKVLAYRDSRFPVITMGARCVLCHQTLGDDARERLAQFEQFVQADTQTRLREARAVWDSRVSLFNDLRALPETIDAHMKDLEPDHAEVISEVRSLLAKYEIACAAIVDALPSENALPRVGLTITGVKSRLESAAAAVRTAADAFSDPQLVKARLTVVTTKRKELELLRMMNDQRTVISDEIERLKERDALESVKNAARTGPITNKILELSEANITEVVRDIFTRETDRLRLERVTIAMTRGEKGVLMHQPKLVGARQDVTLPRVFSEGERTALGLAAFFTEAQLDASKSALILDDPVTSLDHIRRGLVAERLAALAEVRQVVVFTHDVSFVADLKREAKGRGVSVGERSVTRGRKDRKKPGTCTTNHPWKAKDVTERLGDLRRDLTRMKKESSDWDETTYENEAATWAGNLSETWERIISQELVGPIFAEGGLEVRPNMVKILTRFSETDEREFQASYSRVSQWAKRHDKSSIVNYVPPEVSVLEGELGQVEQWFKRIRKYKE